MRLGPQSVIDVSGRSRILQVRVWLSSLRSYCPADDMAILGNHIQWMGEMLPYSSQSLMHFFFLGLKHLVVSFFVIDRRNISSSILTLQEEQAVGHHIDEDLYQNLGIKTMAFKPRLWVSPQAWFFYNQCYLCCHPSSSVHRQWASFRSLLHDVCDEFWASCYQLQSCWFVERGLYELRLAYRKTDRSRAGRSTALRTASGLLFVSSAWEARKK